MREQATQILKISKIFKQTFHPRRDMDGKQALEIEAKHNLSIGKCNLK